MDLRCGYKKHATLTDDFIEVKCGSRFCGARAGVVVLHRFSVQTGRMVETLRFKDPLKEVHQDGSERHPASVRSA